MDGSRRSLQKDATHSADAGAHRAVWPLDSCAEALAGRCLLGGVLATALVAEAAAALEEAVADLVELLDRLLDVPVVLAAALVTVAAAPLEVVVADLVDLLHRAGLGDAGLALARLARRAVAALATAAA
eukprot:CAMPEP_0180305676 /NCGR_PEP_ID=MMETSP0988-20121125/26531_1 /TAXON_ID=697907 /ORGANISM="non described non described, Strain CCMP2293" /LENGTH=128 /DNA_ID=CAMNT_0022288081 /DNA_START=114 /DNA_END=496 /DNA_ORIENTATION=+